MKNTILILYMAMLMGALCLSGQAQKDSINLLSLQEGTFPVVVAESYSGWPVEGLVDESPTSGWACPEGKIAGNVFVFELVVPVTLARFEFDNAGIVLDEVLGLLRSEPAWKLMIEGHTDATGGDAHNQSLSQQRAESVKAYLVAAGIAGERLQTKGYGESKPVADNASELGRAQNRRVELVRQ